MRAGLRNFVEAEAGTTVVEFAIVVPVLILVLVACLDVARALNAQVIVANASREAARYATVHPSADWTAIRGFLAGRVSPLDPTALTGTVNYTPSSDPRWTAAAAPLTVTVAVSYRWDAATWLVGTYFSSACLCRTFTATSSMDVER